MDLPAFQKKIVGLSCADVNAISLYRPVDCGYNNAIAVKGGKAVLKRMFWLALSCVVFFLLLGLMVQHDTMAPPISAQVHAQSALLPVRLQLSSIEYCYEANAEIHPFIFCQIQNIALLDSAQVLPLQPFHLQNYHAFHYSDEAG